MRFDTLRAIEQLGAFPFDRRAGSEGEERAADLATAAFERAGFRVHRAERVGSPVIEALRLGLSRLGSVAGFSAPAVAAAFGRWSLPFAVVSVALGLGWPWLVARAVEPLLKGGWLRSSQGSKRVEAHRDGHPDAPVRVVFVTALGTPRPILNGTSIRVGRRVKAGLTVVTVCVGLAPGALPRESRAAFLLALVAAYLVAASVDLLQRVLPKTPPRGADNRDGLATLSELARVWPAGRDERIEIHFQAVTGQIFDRAGLGALRDQIGHGWRRKPTLVIGLWSPGLGPPFDLSANGLEGYEVMTDAAESLWIPHRSADGRDLWPFGNGDPDFVAVVGASGRATVTPESLALAAQLATEIALRWAKRAEAAQVESRARSSQNPG